MRIDKRFAPILEDEAFSSNAKVDRYGRKLPKGKTKQDLRRFYRIEDEEAAVREDIEGQDDIDDEAVERELKRLDSSKEDSKESEESDTESSDSSSEDDESEDLDEKNEEVFGIVEGNGNEDGAIPRGEVSSRLAVVNLDWDNIRAPDLMAVFQSFIPTTGEIVRVAVYPSEFGKERMEREELEGPPQEIFAKKSEEIKVSNDVDEDEDLNSEDGEDDERVKQSLLKEDTGAEFSSTHLRRYQLSRLRYYYAVITCSSESAASVIYDAVDGTEYLTTANFFDLRFIPDEMSFEDDTPRDECTKLPDGYRPNDFVTEALQHSKVKLTWDADDRARKEVQKRAFGGSRKDIDENDLKAYLGSDSEDDNDDDNEEADETAPGITSTASHSNGKASKKEADRQRQRALLGLPTSPDPPPRKSKTDAPVGDMQVTFSSGLTASGSNDSVFENSPELDETTVEKYVRKEKERKAKRREKMKANRTGAADEPNDQPPAPSHSQPTAEKEDETPAATTTPAAAAAAAEGKGDDLGFNDPFFTSPTTTAPPPNPSTTSTKALRRQKRLEHEAAESAAALERANLERLIAAPPTTTTTTTTNPPIKHFHLPTLLRGQNLATKPHKKKHKLSARDTEALAAAAEDDFEVDVGDERFREVFERAEFAIDPGHPRFSGSGGMRRLLEEGRRVKGLGGGDEGGGGGRGVEGEGEGGKGEEGKGKGKKRRRDGGEREGGGGDEVGELVAKVKRRMKG